MENRHIKWYFSFLRIFALSAILISLFSCSLTKNLPEKESLFLGTRFKLKDKQDMSTVEGIKTDLEELKYPYTIRGLGNIYLGLYNVYNETPDEGFRHWVKYKLGKPPVFYNDQYRANTEAKLTYYLNGKGFFNNSVSCDTTSKGRTVKMECLISLGDRYKIDSLIFPVDSTYTALKLDNELQRAVLKEGNYYDRERLDYERIRLATLANEIGFADFGQENVFYYVDTTKSEDWVDIYLNIIQPSDSTFHSRFTLDSIQIYPNYTLDQDRDLNLKTTSIGDSMTVHEFEHYLNHSMFDRVILENVGDYYNRTLERKSLNRLLDLGLFRYVNFENRISTQNPRAINQSIYLTPEDMQLVSGEVELNNRSGNFFGTGASARYRHRNLFGNAELFNLTLSGQIEAQFGDGLGLVNSSDVNLNAELIIPRIMVPFVNIRESRQFIPRTTFNGNYTYQRRIQFYTLQSASGKFGYKWKDNARNQHEFYPLTLNQVLVRNKTEEFEEILDQDPRLQQSFNDVLIGGLQYSYTYSNQVNRDDRQYKYFKGSVESSGNLFGFLLKGDKNQPKKILGMEFAQYTKVTLDYRRYFPIQSTDLATRIILGGGLAYGNSEEMSYIKQYLIGGSNSIRAFRLRGLGPGTFVPDPNTGDDFNTQFVDQTGDLKLEMNVEYRFGIFNFLKGALFLDAGNIWLINNNDQPRGNFKFDQFYNQIALGTGFGTRLDFDFFLIRLDIAFPLRTPIYNEGFKWVARDIDPFSKSWRNDNLIYNLGIGYPF